MNLLSKHTLALIMLKSKSILRFSNAAIRFIPQMALLVLALAGSAVLAQNISLTPEQLAQLEALTPDQRQALLSGQGSSAPIVQTQLTQPSEVLPRATNDPNQQGIEENVAARLGQATVAQDVELK